MIVPHHPTTLDELLRADHDEPGCNAGATTVQAYADLQVAGRDAAAVYPDWDTHLQACPACRQDYEGPVEAVRLYGE
ncbi:MAG TPA: hypothetical protein VFA96_03090 [Nocardioides sp.]|nr:hypothetical protein [Nocardioides sp.]